MGPTTAETLFLIATVKAVTRQSCASSKQNEFCTLLRGPALKSNADGHGENRTIFYIAQLCIFSLRLAHRFKKEPFPVGSSLQRPEQVRDKRKSGGGMHRQIVIRLTKSMRP
jgi:hypothetical protein